MLCPKKKGDSKATKFRTWLGLDKKVHGAHPNALESRNREKFVTWSLGAGSSVGGGLGFDLRTGGLGYQPEDAYSSLTAESGGILVPWPLHQE